jgi:hypothetical protein
MFLMVCSTALLYVYACFMCGCVGVTWHLGVGLLLCAYILY